MTDHRDSDKTGQTEGESPRRRFLSTSSKALMVAGLAGGYGALGAVAGRFLYPAAPPERDWLFVSEEARLAVGDSILFRAPSGERISVTRQARGGDAGDFIALSSVCPHLGCQVHWEAQNDRFFCPCHNGTFDSQGVGTGGPPGDAGQSLPRYDLKIEDGMLFIHLAGSELADGGAILDEAGEISGPGHDPCLHSAAKPTRRA